MPAQPFKPISWSRGDAVTIQRMQQMSDNSQWLMDNKVQGFYNAHGIRSTTTLKLACGVALVTARATPTAEVVVRFNDYFTPNSKPVVTTTIVSNYARRFSTTIQGIGGSAMHPDSRGFEIHLFADADVVKNRKFPKNLYVSWQAMGY